MMGLILLLGWIPVAWMLVGIYELFRIHNCNYGRTEQVGEKCIHCKFASNCHRNGVNNIAYRKYMLQKAISIDIDK